MDSHNLCLIVQSPTSSRAKRVTYKARLTTKFISGGDGAGKTNGMDFLFFYQLCF